MIKTETRRIFFRKETAIFTVSFFEDPENTIAAVPLDSGQYPAYTIYDISNQVVQSGIGQPEGSPGTYKAILIVAPDAPLTYDESRYRIEWNMVTNNLIQLSFTEEFDIRDEVITQSKSREQKYITLCKETARVFVRLTRRPAEIRLNVYIGGSETKVVDSVSLGGGILEAVEGDSYVYYYDIDGDTMGNNRYFSVIWSVRETVTAIEDFVYQSLTSVSPNMLNMVTSLRMLIDKFQKRLGTVQAYEDSDLVEYLTRGTELVNSYYPTTYYPAGYNPSTLNVFIIMASAWYGLQAQYLLETELGINFSGQTVTLDYDHTSNISDILSRWQDFLNENLPKAKMSLVRRSSSVGTVGARPYRYTDPMYMTYKVSALTTGSGGNVLGLLNHLGLLW